MNPFLHELRELDGRLDLPQPARSRLLLEVAADLDDLYALFLSEGRGREESRRRALEMVDLSDEALNDLTRVHTSGLRRLLDGLSGTARGRVERLALLVVLAVIVLVAGRPLLGRRIFVLASPAIWAVAAFATAAAVIGLQKLYLLLIRQDHRPPRLRRGLGALPGLALACLAAGIVAHWVDLWLTARSVLPDPAGYLPHLVDWALRGAATLVISFHAAIFCALLWFVLERRVAGIERLEAEQLLDDS